MNESTLLDCHLPAAYLCRIISNHPFRVHTDQADNYTLHTHTHTHTHTETSHCRRTVQSYQKVRTLIHVAE